MLQPWQHEHPVPNIHGVSNFFFISALDECYPKFITEYVIIYFMYVLSPCHRLKVVIVWIGGHPPQKMSAFFGLTFATFLVFAS